MHVCVGSPFESMRTAMVDRRTRVEALYQELRMGSGYMHVPEVWPKELHARLVRDATPVRTPRASNLVLVDVRERDERKVSRLHRCAVSREECMEMLQDGQLQDREVVAYCTVGHRSGWFASRLRARGVDAKNLAGSALLWTHEGYPLVDEHDQETRQVHVYSKDWSLEAEGYQPVWYTRAPTLQVAFREIKERMKDVWRKLASRRTPPRRVQGADATDRAEEGAEVEVVQEDADEEGSDTT